MVGIVYGGLPSLSLDLQNLLGIMGLKQNT